MASIRINLGASEVAKIDSVSTIDLFADYGDLLLNRESEIVQELEVRGGFAARNNCCSELAGSGSTFCPVITDNRSIGTASNGQFLYKGKFCGGIRARKG